MNRILAIHPGTSFHIECLEAPRYAGYFDQCVRPENLAQTDLTAFDVVLVPCRTAAQRMIPHAPALLAYLNQGGTVVAMGESDSDCWLPNIRFTPQPTNWWWWLEPGADLGVHITAPPHHTLFAQIDQAAVSWHLHGFFYPPPGAEIWITDGQDRAVLYLDRVSTAGQMLITSLDPFYHHGSHFMPATTRFLDGFLPWLRHHPFKDCSQ